MNLTELYAKADYQDKMGMLFHGGLYEHYERLEVYRRERERERE